MFEDALRNIPEDSQTICREIIQHTLDLGYRIRKDKINNPSYSFYSPKYKQTILRITDNGNDFKMRLKFFGVKNYSSRFEDAIKETLEEYQFKYTGCYQCGKCATGPLGYTVPYEDGRKYFRCGHELIELKSIDPAFGREILEVIDQQTDYWKKLISTISG